jgi:hypothetical protein
LRAWTCGIPARNVGWIAGSLGERAILGAVDAILLSRPPVCDLGQRPPAPEQARLRAEPCDAVVEVVDRDNPEALVCVGIPFRPYQTPTDPPARRHHDRRRHRTSGSPNGTHVPGDALCPATPAAKTVATPSEHSHTGTSQSRQSGRIVSTVRCRERGSGDGCASGTDDDFMSVNINRGIRLNLWTAPRS